MQVSQVNVKSVIKTGKVIGMAAGFAGYVANVLRKEGKDVFVSAANEAVKNGLNPNVGIAVKAGSIGAFAMGTAIVGRVAGGIIGKAFDKFNENKEERALRKQLLDIQYSKIDSSDVDCIDKKSMKKIIKQEIKAMDKSQLQIAMETENL